MSYTRYTMPLTPGGQPVYLVLEGELKSVIEEREALKAKLQLYHDDLCKANDDRDALRAELESLKAKCGTCDNQGIIYPVKGYDPIHGEILDNPQPCPECDELTRYRQALEWYAAAEEISVRLDGDDYETNYATCKTAVQAVAKEALGIEDGLDPRTPEFGVAP